MSESQALTRRVIVEGLVQGVGYRDFVRRTALRHSISGWARNRADGTVEAVIAGAAADVEAMLAELRRGPRGATVTSVRLIEPAGGMATAGTFVIRPSF